MAYGLLGPTDFLAPTPVTLAAGATFAHDPRGWVDGIGRYIYAIFDPANFWRYDIWSDDWQRLIPPAPGAPVFGAGVAMCVDPSRDSLFLWLPDSGGAGATFWQYIFSTDTWAALNIPIGLGPGAWTTSARLLHFCRLENATVSDDTIYLIGNSAVDMYSYSIATNIWTALIPVGVRTGPPGAGTTLDWIPGRSADVLYSLRGDSTGIMDAFTISTLTWAALGFTPAPIITYGTGTCSVPDPITPGIVIQHNNSMNLSEFAFPTNNVVPEISPAGIFPGVDGAAHVGGALAMGRAQDGTAWFYFAKHSCNTFLRTQRML